MLRKQIPIITSAVAAMIAVLAMAAPASASAGTSSTYPTSPPRVAQPAPPAASPDGDFQTMVTCYDGSVAITLPRAGYSPTYTASSRCADINLRIDSGGGMWVAVCWAKYGTCQSGWTWVSEDVGYRTVATGVVDGTTFYFVTSNENGGGNRSGRTAY